MRNAMIQLSAQRTPSEERQVLRAAIRQLERADIYLAAVAYMDLDDPAISHAVGKLRADLEALRRHVSDRRVDLRS